MLNLTSFYNYIEPPHVIINFYYSKIKKIIKHWTLCSVNIRHTFVLWKLTITIFLLLLLLLLSSPPFIWFSKNDEIRQCFSIIIGFLCTQSAYNVCINVCNVQSKGLLSHYSIFNLPIYYYYKRNIFVVFFFISFHTKLEWKRCWFANIYIEQFYVWFFLSFVVAFGINIRNRG